MKKNLLFSIIVFLIFILILEFVLRTTHIFNTRLYWCQPDTLIGFSSTPNAKYWHFEENDHPITGRINNFGWRDYNWTKLKPKNTYRIAVLGDSHTEALEIELDSTFLKLTEKQLNQSRPGGTKFELMNFGRSGTSQIEQLIILKNYVIHFQPDMVIVFISPNDIEDIRIAPETKTGPFFTVTEKGKLILDTSFSKTKEFKLKRIVNFFKQHSAIVSIITRRYSGMKMVARNKEFNSQISTSTSKIKGVMSLATVNPDTSFLKAYALTKLLIENMANFCKERNIKFMLVCTDNIAYTTEQEQEELAIDSTFNANFFEDDLQKFCIPINRDIDIEYIGLQRPFAQYYKETRIPLRWYHWNYEGHRLIAKILTEKLKTL